jgi:histidinol phosphatase-like PHP family hydrolase
MEKNRRDFLKTLSLGTTIALFPELVLSKDIQDNDIQLFDYHVHLSKELTISDAVSNFRGKNMKFGILEHPGPRYSKMVNDDLLLEYIRKYESYDVFIGLQPVDPGWHKQFSPEVLSKIRYVVMDALEIPDGKGNYEAIWEQRFVLNNKSTFMDRYLDFYVEILENEKINILANPTFLPICLAPDYYKLWTEKRMDKVIRYAVKNKVALEINSVYQYPKKPFIEMAKEAGAKFTFGSNGHNIRELKNYDYCLEMVKDCKLTNDDFLIIT